MKVKTDTNENKWNKKPEETYVEISVGLKTYNLMFVYKTAITN